MHFRTVLFKHCRLFVLTPTCMEMACIKIDLYEDSFVPTFVVTLYCCLFLIACMKYKIITAIMKHTY